MEYQVKVEYQWYKVMASCLDDAINQAKTLHESYKYIINRIMFED